MEIKFDPFITSLSQRVLYLVALTCGLIVVGFVYHENTEIQKVIKPTFWSKVSLFLFQYMAIIMANYVLAGKEKNWTDKLTEFCMVTAAGCACVAFVGPSIFAIEVKQGTWWIPFSGSTTMKSNLAVRLVAFVPFTVLTTLSIWRLRAYVRARSLEQSAIDEKVPHPVKGSSESD